MERIQAENAQLKEETEQQEVKVEELKRDVEIARSEEAQIKKQLDEALRQVQTRSSEGKHCVRCKPSESNPMIFSVLSIPSRNQM